MRAQETRTSERVTVSLPDKSWAVEIDSPGFAVETEGRKADGRQYLLANNPKTGLVLSVTLEESSEGADSKTCPDFLRKRVESISQLGVTDVKASQIGSMAVIEYLLPRPQGIPLQQKNFVACTAKEDVYIDIHLSKVKFQPSDESLFTGILNRVRITDRTQPTVSTSLGASTAASSKPGTTSADYFREGSRYYIANDFHKAIGAYQRALDLEKQRPTLSRNYWRVLVDNLGMAYGITGDLDHAEDTFRYGVSRDPDYPMFYYNLGCTYAERNDMDTAMDFLRKAFALKANSIPGEGMPDPRQDDSFQRFMSNERFRKFLDSLIPSSN
jgi:hypothetical protein